MAEIWNGQNWAFHVLSNYSSAKNTGRNLEWPKLGMLIFFEPF